MNNIITIIPEDNTVIVDSIVTKFSFLLDASIHAIQWKYTSGEIEYNDERPNKIIDDFSQFEYIMEERESAIEAQILAEEATQEAAEAAIEAELTILDKRRREYPSIEEQLEALYANRNGDSTLLVEIDAAIALIDIKYPL